MSAPAPGGPGAAPPPDAPVRPPDAPVRPPVVPVRIGAADVAALLGLPAPTAEQVAVVEAPLEPVLVVAGAGSGKTETMASRVVWLVANGLVTPDRVLGLTFTRKAAAGLADRVGARLRALASLGMVPGRVEDDAPEEPTVSTYHAYAAGLLADHGLRAGVDPTARLVGEAACHQGVSALVEAWEGPPGGLDRSPSAVVQAVLDLTAACAEHLVDPREVDDHLAATLHGLRSLRGRERADVREARAALADTRAVLPLVRAWAARKAEAGVLDFGDQVALAARLARSPAVAAYERARCSVVLLDEYQDTSHAQLELLRSLFGDGHPVTAVGDPHQSIYGWRGASAGNLSAFPEHFPRRARDGADPGAQHGAARGEGHDADQRADHRSEPARVLALSTSWRNDVAVLESANALAAPLRAASTVPVPALAARPDAGAGRVETLLVADVGAEAEAVAELMAGVASADAAVAPAVRRTCAVLCRKRAQFSAVEAALRSRGLAVEVVGLGGLLSRPEVVDVVAGLRVAHDPARGDALVHLLTGPRWRLGVRDLDALDAWAAASRPGRGGSGGRDGPSGSDGTTQHDPRRAGADEACEVVSLAAALDPLPPPGWTDAEGRALSAAGRERLVDLAAVLASLRAQTSLPLPDLVVEVERALGLDVELLARPGADPEGARAHVEALVAAAADFDDAVARPTLGAFLAWLDAAEDRERGLPVAEEGGAPAGTPRAVQVLTVHAAKGLEWDVVAVPGLVEGTLPSLGKARRGWLSGIGHLPHPLRGDAGALPELAWPAPDHESAHEALAAYVEDCAQHTVAEERRLAYVAATRARSHLLLIGAWWGSGVKSRVPSRFLLEAAAAAGHVLPEQPGDAPPRGGARTATWPVDPLGARRADVEAAAAAVRAARAALEAAGAQDGEPSADEPGADGSGTGEPGAPARETVPAPVPDPWAAEVDALLAERERDRERADGALAVELPAHLSASRLVRLAADPAALALAVRRPLPARPSASARRGTAFHAWMEQRHRSSTLVDLDDELLGDAWDDGDDADGGRDGADRAGASLADLQATFEASEWAQRVPLAVEVDLETVLAGLVVRCRVDAVFPAPERGEGGVDVVDWKTGRPPTGARARAAAVQLAVYRLAWSRRHGVPLERVGAAFFHAATGATTRPADLLDEAALEALVTDLPQR